MKFLNIFLGNSKQKMIKDKFASHVAGNTFQFEYSVKTVLVFLN